MEKLAGHEKARKVGDMRVGPITGDYPEKISAAEAESPWESYWKGNFLEKSKFWNFYFFDKLLIFPVKPKFGAKNQYDYFWCRC